MSESNGYTRFFPYDQPFDNQREAMDRIYNALSRGQDVLFEGACGTGKTLASLAPALEYARAENKTVVITTNVHQQARQFRREAAAISESEPIRAVVFRGKGSMCHIDVNYEECQLLRDNTHELVDREQDRAELKARERQLQAADQTDIDAPEDARGAILDELETVEAELDDLESKATCDFYYRNLTADTDEFYQWLFEDVRSPEDIYQYADQQGLCGYELLKDGLENVDLVVCNYHHLLDSLIREQFFRWLDVDPDDVIVVFDEAHNIADAARDHARRTLSERTLDGAIEELDAIDGQAARAGKNVIRTFRDALVDTYEDSFGFGEREQIGDSWEDITIANEDRRDDLTLSFLEQYSGQGIQDDIEAAQTVGRRIDEEYERAYREGDATSRQECQTLAAASFIDDWLAAGGDMGTYPVVSVRRDRNTDTVYGQTELYTCIPSEVTTELFGETHAAILMSATLQPFDVLEDVLGLTSPATMVYGLPFPEANRETYAVDVPPLFASDRDDPTIQQAVADVLADVHQFTPGNVLVFFPNYGEAARYHNRLTDRIDGSLYLDEPATAATDLRENFVEENDGMLFTSLWGTLTEGVSFDGEDARAAVVVGVPYPHLDDRSRAVQQAYQRVFADRPVEDPGWRYAVEIPTIRKTRQALGRVIRSPEDIGTRILVDRRYTASGADSLGSYSVHNTFPEQLTDELVDVDPEKLKFALLNFYQQQDAYEGSPPRP